MIRNNYSFDDLGKVKNKPFGVGIASAPLNLHRVTGVDLLDVIDLNDFEALSFVLDNSKSILTGRMKATRPFLRTRPGRYVVLKMESILESNKVLLFISDREDRAKFLTLERTRIDSGNINRLYKEVDTEIIMNIASEEEKENIIFLVNRFN